MKRLALTLAIFCACCGLAYAGTAYSGKEMKEVAPAPCPQWYADNEWNVSLWGTYAATGTEFAPNPSPEAIMPGAEASISSIFFVATSASASKGSS